MSATAGEEVRQQIADLVRRGAFKPIARFLRAEICEERIAEAIGLTLQMAIRHAANGRRFDDALLVHHARLRALEPSRHLCPSRGRGCDALNQENFIKGRTEVLSIDGVSDESGGEGDAQLIGLALNGNPNPADVLASALDLQSWLADLSKRDRRLLELRSSGLTLQEICTTLDLSISTVFSRCKQLGIALAEAADLSVPGKQRRTRQLH